MATEVVSEATINGFISHFSRARVLLQVQKNVNEVNRLINMADKMRNGYPVADFEIFSSAALESLANIQMSEERSKVTDELSTEREVSKEHKLQQRRATLGRLEGGPRAYVRNMLGQGGDPSGAQSYLLTPGGETQGQVAQQHQTDGSAQAPENDNN